MDEIKRLYYIGDTMAHVRQLMQRDFNQYAIFTTLRNYKKTKKNNPHLFFKANDIEFVFFENEMYKTIRGKREN